MSPLLHGLERAHCTQPPSTAYQPDSGQISRMNTSQRPTALSVLICTKTKPRHVPQAHGGVFTTWLHYCIGNEPQRGTVDTMTGDSIGLEKADQPQTLSWQKRARSSGEFRPKSICADNPIHGGISLHQRADGKSVYRGHESDGAVHVEKHG